MNRYKHAHKIGFYDGYFKEDMAYPKPINEYQREYKRGFFSGSVLSDSFPGKKV